MVRLTLMPGSLRKSLSSTAMTAFCRSSGMAEISRQMRLFSPAKVFTSLPSRSYTMEVCLSFCSSRSSLPSGSSVTCTTYSESSTAPALAAMTQTHSRQPMNRMMVPNILRRGLFFFFFPFFFWAEVAAVSGLFALCMEMCRSCLGSMGTASFGIIAAGAKPACACTDTRPHSAVTQMGIKP